jgi:hypothetical protein
MFYEDVKVKRGETVSGLGVAYGYKASEWRKIWDHPRNLHVVARSRVPERLQIGEMLYVPISWMVVTKTLTPKPDGAAIVLERDGELGKRLTWVQTVYQHNQPIGATQPFCVDGCPADDNLPFYWTDAEIAADKNLRKRFSDYSHRPRPTAAMGTTRWRAVVSLAVVTDQRVSIWNSIVWGWNLPVIGPPSVVGPRPATGHEVQGHLNLLRKGLGTGPLTFGTGGWTFQLAPMEIGDFPTPSRDVQYA